MALLLLVSILAVAACAEESPSPVPPGPTEPGPSPVQVGSASPSPQPTPVPTVATPSVPLAALVNGQPIALAEYERRVQQYANSRAAQGVDMNTAEEQALLAQVRRDVLESLIDYALIEQAAAEMGIAITDDDLEAQIGADITAGGGQAAFDEWLAATGQTRDDYKQVLHETLLTRRVMDAVTADLPAAAEQVHARHIQVDSQDAAAELLAQLQGGADFAAMARERSTDLATRDSGGDLGWFPRGLVAPELENVAFALQPGEISNPVLFDGAYHFIQVIEREEARQLSPEVAVQLKLALFKAWLEGRRRNAALERFASE